MVRRTVARLDEIGEGVSHVAAKATIQVAREMVQAYPERKGDALMRTVSRQLQERRVIMPPRLAHEILVAYTGVVVDMDVAEVVESPPAPPVRRIDD